jgi:glycosyltransferase involved in cell wall biosynthesis
MVEDARRVHIFNGFHNPYGGSELEALNLFTLLKAKHETHLWATSSRASSELKRKFPISSVGAGAVNGGNYVFVGAHWRGRVWPFLIRRPKRLIYIYNTFHPKHTAIASRPPWGWPKTEFVFVSDFQKRHLGLDGVVHPSPIDIQLFTQRPVTAGVEIKVGRLSRDAPDKHNSDDLPIYRELAGRNVKVRLQGASCLVEHLRDPNIEIMPGGAEPAARFLQSLDIFYYRSGCHVETFGRVVFEAMACGLPVVCHNYGGYADWIVHGENGFLFSRSDEAREILGQLIANPRLRHVVGANARKTIESMYGKDKVDQRLAFYVQ